MQFHAYKPQINSNWMLFHTIIQRRESFFRLESGGAVTVIDERQFLAFWQVNKHTTDVREKKIGKIISGLIGVITIKHL